MKACQIREYEIGFHGPLERSDGIAVFQHEAINKEIKKWIEAGWSVLNVEFNASGVRIVITYYC